MPTIRAYICSKTLEAPIFFEDLSSQADVTDVDAVAQKVTTKIRPESLPSGCVVPRFGKFPMPLRPVTDPDPCEPRCGYYEGEPSNMISWSRGEFDQFPTIKYRNPAHCQWVLTELRVTGPLRCGNFGCLIAATFPDPPGGEIPDSREDAQTGGVDTETQQTQNSIVPGMRMRLFHTFSETGLQALEADFDWWCTCCFSGGTITQKIGKYGQTDLEFKVEVEGIELDAVPSDFAEWEVGDWVFVTSFPLDGQCKNVTRDHGCKSGCGWESGDKVMILPLTIGADGA